MPQIVKGGKYVFGWCVVGRKGDLPIPPEAMERYELPPDGEVIVFPGSKTSGGVGLSTPETLRGSNIYRLIEEVPDFRYLRLPEGAIVLLNNKEFCWTWMKRSGRIRLPLKTWKVYGIGAGDRLLCVRGSRYALGFVARGMIHSEALRHLEIETFK